jgi:alpha-mannosidase
MCVWNNKNVADAPESLLLFGNGDGGGGPTPEMLEKVSEELFPKILTSTVLILDHSLQLERLSSVAIKNGEVPAFKIGKPADFFDRLLVISQAGQTLPSWRGELYLEFHRGVSRQNSFH